MHSTRWRAKSYNSKSPHTQRRWSLATRFAAFLAVLSLCFLQYDASSSSIASFFTSPPAWLGPGHPPLSSLSSSSSPQEEARHQPPQRRHLRVIIRIHHEHEELIHHLISDLRQQAAQTHLVTNHRLVLADHDHKKDGEEKKKEARVESGNMKDEEQQQQQQTEKDGLGIAAMMTIDFVLVATELKGLALSHQIARREYGLHRDVFAPAGLTKAWYEKAQEVSRPLRCSVEEKMKRRVEGGEERVKGVCDYDNHAFYQATDVAVSDFIISCPWCTHLLVTNDDNGYEPTFLSEIFSPSPPSSSSQEPPPSRYDLITTDFLTKGELHKEAKWERGYVDLGGVIASKRMVEKVQGFIPSLPPGARAVEAHDADWWFVKKAIQAGATCHIIPQVLYHHN